MSKLAALTGALALLLPSAALAQYQTPQLGSYNPAATTNNVGVSPAAVQATSAYAFKASAGNLYGWDLDEGATAAYFCFLDLAAAPSAGAAISPKFCLYSAANGTAHYRQDVPDRFVNGVVVVSTSSVTTYTAVTPAIIGASVQ